MKALNGRSIRAVLAGLSLLAGAGVVHAWDTETGLIHVGITTSGSFEADAVEVTMVDAEPLGVGRCNGDGMLFELVGEGSKAVYQSLLAANIAGKAVTLEYVLNEDDSCTLVWARL